MRNQLNMRYFFLVLLSVFLVTSSFAQKVNLKSDADIIKLKDQQRLNILDIG